MIGFSRFIGASCLLGLSFATLAARADDAPPPPPDKKLIPTLDDGKGRKNGVDAGVIVGFQSALNDSENVIGQTDGATFAIGLKFLSLVNLNHDAHEWRNTLSLGEGITRTPAVGTFLKSRDALAFESVYLYHVVDWFGPFVRVSWDTALFRGTDIRPTPTTYLITRPGGAIQTINASRLALTDPLHPSTFKQSVGPFVRPISSDLANLEFRVGLGGLEILAANQRVITDDPTTPNSIEVTELSSLDQLGIEEVVSFWGATAEKKVVYKAKAEVMTPVAHTALPSGDDRGALALTNIEVGGLLSFKLVPWASLDYELKAIKQPELLDRFQVQNNLLLTFGVSAGTVPKGK